MTLEVSDIDFSYGKKKVLNGISLSIDNGEIYSLLGGSGSGKTTLMNIIAGFLERYTGKVTLDGKDLSRQPTEKRGVGMVFQEYALFPHMSVQGNISFPLKVKGIRANVMKGKVSKMIERMELTGLERNMPSELSGGERQRVALARMLASDPKFLLLDEPLSALDASLRDELRRDLRSILKESGIPALYVTHDQEEAMAISDRIGFLHDGRILEEGTPDDLFWRPKGSTTARFMGINNIFDVRGSRDGHLITDIGSIPWDERVPERIAFRPGSSVEDGDGIVLSGEVVETEYRGRDHLVRLKVRDSIVMVVIPPRHDVEKGTRLEVVIPKARIIGLKR